MITVLVVDDRAEERERIVALLRDGGMRVLAACDNSEALRVAGSERLDLIVTGLSGQGVEKAQLLRGLREDPALAATRVVAAAAREKAAAEPETAHADRFLQAQKMEALGRLAGVVAHDFNNLLTIILGYGQRVRGVLARDAAAARHVEAIVSAAERAAVLTNQLRTFGCRQVVQPRLLNLNTVIEESRHLLARLLRPDIELAITLDPHLEKIEADPCQLQQILLNLITNARDAIPARGLLTISTSNAPAPEPRVTLTVSDTGSGIEEEHLARIFEPFFTTKAPEKGSGLGLAAVYGIVKQGGGDITVESRPGQGAKFTISLPRARAPESESAAAPAQLATLATSLQGRETILVVEHEVAVRQLARDVLEEHGYTLLEADNCAAALTLCAEHAAPIQLLLTDVVMPRMRGVELARLALAHRPSLKVLYMSGYSGDAIAAGGLRPGDAFVQKPFTPEALARKVREALDGARGASILVVEDEDSLRRLLRTLLEEAGFDVVDASNGQHAMKRLMERPVDVLLTDLVMPDQEGMETILAARQSFPDMKVIAMSGAFDGKYLRMAGKLGAHATLSKPLQAEKLIETVRGVLAPPRA